MKTLTYSEDRKELIYEDDKVNELRKDFFQDYELATMAKINLKRCSVLHSFDFFALKYLTKLQLVAPTLLSVDAFTFKGLTLLTLFHFEATKITKLPTFLFYDLKKLKHVLLIVNQATAINSFVNKSLRKVTLTCSVPLLNSIRFLELRNLQILKITASFSEINRFMTINCCYFTRLRNLQHLSVRRAYCFQIELNLNLKHLQLIECFVSESDFVTDLLNLTNLEIRDCNVDVDCTKFVKNSSLRNLILNNNLIPTLGDNVFNLFKDLVYLDLSDCQIAEIQNNFLGQASKSINVIKLNSNRLISLRSNVFHDCERLFSLDLGNNQLVVLFKHAFDSLCELVTLDLQNNKLSELPTKIFSNLNSLKCLNLSSNHLQQLSANWFNLNDYYVLESLDLSSNLIYFCDPNCFKMLTNLKRLNLSHNRLTFLNNRLFDNLELLTDLNLGSNQIRILKSEIFKYCKWLNSVKLDFNNLNRIVAGTFDNVTKLKLLHLNNNYLTELPDDVFKMNWELQFLNLNNNLLHSPVQGDIFSRLYSIQVLRLENNRLRILCWKLFENNGNLHSLHVDGYLKQSLIEKLPKIRIF